MKLGPVPLSNNSPVERNVLILLLRAHITLFRFYLCATGGGMVVGAAYTEQPIDTLTHTFN